MSNRQFSPDDETIRQRLQEQLRWAKLMVDFGEIRDDNVSIVREMSRYDLVSTVGLLSGLLTVPALQTNCIRIEVLVGLAITACRKGGDLPDIQTVVNWFNMIGESRCTVGEDPAEDVFVSMVSWTDGDYCLLEGIWESAGFYTQRIIDVVNTMPASERFTAIKTKVRALLVISDIVCSKAHLERYEAPTETHSGVLTGDHIPSHKTLVNRVTISFEELNAMNVSFEDIAPFVLFPQKQKKMARQRPGNSNLDKSPLLRSGPKQITVALPTSLSVAMREYVIEQIVRLHLAERFNEALSRVYSSLFLDTLLLGDMKKAPIFWRKQANARIAELCSEVEAGHPLCFLFFLPPIQAHAQGGLKEPIFDDGTLTEAIRQCLQDSMEHFEANPSFQRGTFLVCGCGWGKGYASRAILSDNPKWRLETVSSADLFSLSWLPSFTSASLWRVLKGLEVAEEAGVHLENPNGILNLVGWVRKNKGRVVPHAELPEAKITPETPLVLAIPTDEIRDVRVESYRAYDRHQVRDNIGGLHVLQRAFPNPFFHSPSHDRLYASTNDLTRHQLTAVYDGKSKLWLTIDTPDSASSRLTYHLWEMVSEWLHRIGHKFDKCGFSPAYGVSFKVYTVFRDSDVEQFAPGDVIGDLDQLCSIESHEEPNALRVVFDTGFLAAFRSPDNNAERHVVRALIGAYLKLMEQKLPGSDVLNIENQVVRNTDARSFHLFPAKKFVDFVQEDLPNTLLTVNEIDDAMIRIGLAFHVPKVQQAMTIRGKKECTSFLHLLVDVLAKGMLGALAHFQRQDTLTRLVGNWEKAIAEQDHWEKTSAALLGLYDDDDSVSNRAVKQLSKISGASIASRIVGEMALCACALDSKHLATDFDITRLLTQAMLLLRLGGFSDAIHFNVLKPELKVSALGDVLFRDDFGKFVVEPMLSDVIGERFIRRASSQKDNYDFPASTKSIERSIDERFEEIWQIEMGFSVEEGSRIVEVLEDIGIARNRLVFFTKLSEVVATTASNGLPTESIKNFFDEFTLATRPDWDCPPPDFSASDIYPWRYGRRLALATRPILNIDNDADPTLLIAPGVLRKALVYIVGGAHHGTLDRRFFRTPEMRDEWLGKAREGHSFNSEVANRLKQLEWRVRENVGLPEILNQRLERNYGDIDVLAYRPGHPEVLIIECKDLALTRTYSEVAGLLSSYQGVEVSGSPDKLKRHLNRVDRLSSNVADLKKYLRINGKIRLVSCLVFSGTVPMQYAQIDALQNTIVGSIERVLDTIEGSSTS